MYVCMQKIDICRWIHIALLIYNRVIGDCIFVTFNECWDSHDQASSHACLCGCPLQPAAVEVRLEAMEAQLQCCERRLGQLAVLESRLQALERSMAGKVVLEQSHWENLESRVLLLETRLALSETQVLLQEAQLMSHKCIIIIIMFVGRLKKYYIRWTKSLIW